MKEPDKNDSVVAIPKNKDGIKVLDEDTYLENIGKIIERDFYPDLEKLRAQNSYLDAVEKNDVQRLRQIFAKYSHGCPTAERYDASPATFETPDQHTVQEDALLRPSNKPSQEEMDDRGGKAKERPPSPKFSLDQYLGTHTSEDNNSFQEMIQEADEKHKQKFSWLYEAEEKCLDEGKNSLVVPSIEEQAAGLERPLNIETWKYKNRNHIMYVPDGKVLTAAEKMDLVNRKQSVSHLNTRFQQNPFDEIQNRETIQCLAVNQAKALEGKIGVDGKELSSSNTPKVNGWSFVKTPSPAPGITESPLMTWGNIEGTPFRLDGGDTPVRSTPGPSFKIPEPPKREKLALALAEKAGQQHRDRKKKALQAAKKHLSSPAFSPNSGLDRLNSMSPAARRLASSQLKRLGSADLALQASYSPMRASPLSGASVMSPLRRRASPYVASPSLFAAPSTSSGSGPTLTDNLLQLNLPKRPKAADYF
ncbi:splicing factor ESS-2 homolog [Nilaparvata lugens]|uniref:splicing factor ESS-2 homolog n=1 Tax=Nilaparvata lugens TaxID=108931 RepID=UPI00193D8BDB|nr:splicing factor ESS-2 homolog [Nilaparvata lugens]